jgi:hypothetical protein
MEVKKEVEKDKQARQAHLAAVQKRHPALPQYVQKEMREAKTKGEAKRILASYLETIRLQQSGL